MTSSFKVTLDTVAPAFSVTGKRNGADAGALILTIELDDAQELRIWGDIDPLGGPDNANYAEKEEDAPWFPAATELLVRVPSGSVEPKLHISARDEVWNVRTLVRTFPLKATEPAPLPVPGGGGVPGRRPVEVHPEFRMLARSTQLHASARRVVRVQGSRRRGAHLPVRRRQTLSPAPGSLRHARDLPLRVRRRQALAAGHDRAAPLKLETNTTIRRIEPEDDIEAMIVFDLL